VTARTPKPGSDSCSPTGIGKSTAEIATSATFPTPGMVSLATLTVSASAAVHPKEAHRTAAAMCRHRARTRFPLFVPILMPISSQ
jgi:hypothetical protein